MTQRIWIAGIILKVNKFSRGFVKSIQAAAVSADPEIARSIFINRSNTVMTQARGFTCSTNKM